ncbi:serine/threonine-protein kinase [Actinomycetospora sp.]|uniref:serine/threonine-protein kinase n=1 Tax=Actinomycetospora sp. TaxID=1872135 RepID=UPI002F3FD76C
MAQDDQLIAGRYRLSTQVGSGAMGVVWRAEDETLRRTVALKQVLLPSGVDDPTRERAYRRVMREGRLFARLHHPNAIAVFDVVDHDSEPWLVMEYLPSQSLSEAVTAHGVLSPAVAASVGHQVAAALAAAHEAGIVHRDVKPGNVLLGHANVVKVTDFGISRAVDEATITSGGMMAGTPAYLAPEVARGAEADFRSDVYSLGSTIYAAVEGEPPFGQGENALAQLHRVATGEYTPPRHGGALTPLLERLLAGDPARRPEMHQVRDELGRLAAVDAETDEWPEARREPTGPTLPVTPPPLVASPSRDGSGQGGPGATPVREAGRVALATASPSGPPTRTPPTAQAARERTPSASDTVVGRFDDEDGPDDGARRRRRRRRRLGIGLAVLLLGAAVAVALVLGRTGGDGATIGATGPAPTTAGEPGSTGSDQASGDGSGTGTGTGTAAPAPGTPDQIEQQQAIIDYYARIPSDLPDGWERLTPGYQQNTAGGFAGYSGFWGTVQQVTVRGVSPGADDTVDATVTYVHDGGRSSEERTLFRLVRQDGIWKIDGSQVLTSR